MGTFEVLVIRLILSVLLALLISRFFFQDRPFVMVFCLAFVMLGLAYLLEYLRKRNKGGTHHGND